MLSRLEKKFFPVLLTFPLLIVVIFLVKEYQSNHVQAEAPPVPNVSHEVSISTSSAVAFKELASAEPALPLVIQNKQELYEYVKVVNSCDHNYRGTCVNVRTKPNSSAMAAYKLRTGIILRVDEKVHEDGRDWYRVNFDEWLRYPDRVSKNLYVAAEFVEPFFDEGSKNLENSNGASSTKRIVVDRTKQVIYAYDGDELFMKEKVSTGIEVTPTPRGTFTIYRKTPSRYMQGPIPGISSHYYDLPGVPWNLYFSKDGAVIHGAYWHDSFGRKWSNGCVNLPMASAEKLYKWADVGTKVVVRD